MKPGDTGEITSIRPSVMDKTNWLRIRLDKTGGIHGEHNEIYFELVTKTPTFTNQIITDIKDQEQADRIGKKLDSMGGRAYINIKWSEGKNNIIKFNYNGYYYTYVDNEPTWTHITANKFLGEEDNLDTLQHMVDRSHYWSLTSVPGYFKGTDSGNSMRDKQFKKFNYNTPTTPSSVKGNNIMSSIVNFAKDLLLSTDEKLLRKYGLHDENGNNSSVAEELIMDKFLNSPENQAYLLEVATAKQAEDKSNKEYIKLWKMKLNL